MYLYIYIILTIKLYLPIQTTLTPSPPSISTYQKLKHKERKYLQNLFFVATHI